MLPAEIPKSAHEQQHDQNTSHAAQSPRGKTVTLEQVMAELERIIADPEPDLTIPDRWDGLA